MAPAEQVLTLSATEFKAKCLSILDQLQRRKLDRVIVTKRGKPAAELHSPREVPPVLWGAMEGSVKIASEVDLIEPAFTGAVKTIAC